MYELINNPTLTQHKKVKEICKPLDSLNISYFSHANIDSKGRFSVLCNNPGFIELYYRKEYFNVDLHTANIDNFGSYVIWDNVPRCGKTLGMGEDAADLNIIHTFSIIDRSQKDLNIFHFSTHLDDNSMNQVYLSNLPLLKKFISYFKKQVNSDSSLSGAFDLKVEVNQTYEGYSIDDNLNLFTDDKKRRFLKMIDPNLSMYEKFTNRELDCLKFLVKGKSSREIGEILNVSKRTVEFYIVNIKSKLHVSKKSTLIEKVSDLFA